MNRSTFLRWIALVSISLCAGIAVSASGAAAASPRIEFTQSKELFGGVPALIMRRQRTGDGKKPEFLSVTMLPGRGMDVLQITVDVPGRGETEILESPSIAEAAKIFGGPEDQFGNQAFHMGSAFLIPFANRMLGDLPTNDGPVTVNWEKQQMHLVANVPPTSDGRHYALHGMLSSEAAAAVSQHAIAGGGVVEATFHCGNFHGHWPSETDVDIRVTLTADGVFLSATARNVGHAAEPMGIGTHPYFRILSGDRAQVLLHVPGRTRTLANNYTDVFPTGKVVPVAGSAYDFRAPGGVALGSLPLDDQWGDLVRDPNGAATAVLIDPAAHVGLRVSAISPEIKAIQVYAPLDKKFVAIEDQFNRNDPFGSEWNGQPTGMVRLAPGASVTWKQSIQAFVP